MTASPGDPGRAPEVCLHAGDLDATIDFFVSRLGFRLDVISPADDPRSALLSRPGLHLRLDRDGPEGGLLRIPRDLPRDLPRDIPRDAIDLDVGPELLAPNGCRIEFLDPPDELQPPAFSGVTVVAADQASTVGRAGLVYLDLLPDRAAGGLIASRISIAEAGPVPDYVHHHRVGFQLIYCHRGWVRVVYEDQGPPFVLAAGDAVTQPPGIRHRVLESSAGLEVIEVASPAEHDTLVDHELTLPTADLRPDRAFDGQTFVHHRVATAESAPADHAGLIERSLGLEGGTGGSVRGRVLTPGSDAADAATDPVALGGRGGWATVLDGHAVLTVTEADGSTRAEPLSAGAAYALGPQIRHRIMANRADTAILELRFADPVVDSVPT